MREIQKPKSRGLEKISKKNKKVLDKQLSICYNNYIR
jgi:hypothetical protein